MQVVARQAASGLGLTDGWIDLAPDLHYQIAEFALCGQDGTIPMAITEIEKSTFRGGFTLSYGSDGIPVTWANMLKFLDKSSRTTKPTVTTRVRRGMINQLEDPYETLVEGINTQSEKVMRMFKNIGTEALRYYHMFGMCPIGVKRTRFGDDEQTDESEDALQYGHELYVPDPLSGHFVYRKKNKADIEFGWKWREKSSGRVRLKDMATMKMRDKSVQVVVWPGKQPSVNCSKPFSSTIQPLRQDYYFRLCAFQTHTAIMMRMAKPLVAVQSERAVINTEDLPPSEQWNDHLNGGDPNESLQHLSNLRVEQSFRERFESSMDYMHQVSGTMAPVIDESSGLVHLGSLTASAEYFPMPVGSKPTPVPSPKPYGNVHSFDEWFKNKVFAIFRIPQDFYGGPQSAKRSTVGTEQVNRLMEDTTEFTRDLIVFFWEEAWSKLFSKMEKREIDQRRAMLKKQEDRERLAAIEYLRYLVTVMPNDPSIPDGLTAANFSELDPSLSDIDGVDEEEKTEPLGLLQQLLFKEIEQNTKIDTITQGVMGHAYNRGVLLNEVSVRQNVTDLVYTWESGYRIHALEKGRYNAIESTARPLRAKFVEPVHLPATELVFAFERGFLSWEAARKLWLLSKRVPIDTPPGHDPTLAQVPQSTSLKHGRGQDMSIGTSNRQLAKPEEKTEPKKRARKKRKKKEKAE